MGKTFFHRFNVVKHYSAHADQAQERICPPLPSFSLPKTSAISTPCVNRRFRDDFPSQMKIKKRAEPAFTSAEVCHASKSCSRGRFCAISYTLKKYRGSFDCLPRCLNSGENTKKRTQITFRAARVIWVCFSVFNLFSTYTTA